MNEKNRNERLNLGCGNDIRSDYINLDKIALPGVDIVWDVRHFPYPFEDNHFSQILAINVLEHLPDTIEVLEELYRISRPEAAVKIRVPYWNSLEQSTDPTHLHFFNEFTFDYFDPSKPLGKRRSYYSNACFKIQSVGAWIFIGNRYFLLSNSFISTFLFSLSHYISNIVRLLEFDLVVLKPE